MPSPQILNLFDDGDRTGQETAQGSTASSNPLTSNSPLNPNRSEPSATPISSQRSGIPNPDPQKSGLGNRQRRLSASSDESSVSALQQPDDSARAAPRRSTRESLSGSVYGKGLSVKPAVNKGATKGGNTVEQRVEAQEGTLREQAEQLAALQSQVVKDAKPPALACHRSS